MGIEAVRDFTDIRDAAAAYRFCFNLAIGRSYNLGSARVSIQQILDGLVALSQANITVEVDPSRLRPADVAYFVANNQKLQHLGWAPQIPLEQTLTDILAYERDSKEKQA